MKVKCDLLKPAASSDWTKVFLCFCLKDRDDDVIVSLTVRARLVAQVNVSVSHRVVLLMQPQKASQSKHGIKMKTLRRCLNASNR